jgi:hypothetical protein
MSNKKNGYAKDFKNHQYEKTTKGKFDFSSNPIVKAVYVQQELPELMGNSLEEALPPPLFRDSEIVNALVKKPDYNDEQRKNSPSYRSGACIRLKKACFPNRKLLDVYKTFDSALRQGYQDRSYFDKQYFDDVRLMPEHLDLNNSELYNLKLGMSILGISQNGKSYSVASVLRLYPQVIIHQTENDSIKRDDFVQLVWLYINCPHNGTRGGLCESILAGVDKILGTDYSVTYGKLTVEKALIRIQHIFFVHRIGILIIDEIEFLTEKNKETRAILNYLVHINNVVGVPIVLVGNFDAYSVLFKNQRQTNRAVGNKFIRMPSLKFEEFSEFANVFWKYQWTNVETALSDELLKELFIQSGGVISNAIKLYVAVQKEVIGKASELITPTTIRKVMRSDFLPLIPFSQALLSNDKNVYSRYPEITVQKQLETIGEINKINEVKPKGVNSRQKRYLNEIENSVQANLVLLGLQEPQFSGIDFKYIINTYLAEEDPSILCNLVTSKVIEIIRGDKKENLENKPNKEEVNQMINDLEKDMIDKL